MPGGSAIFRPEVVPKAHPLSGVLSSAAPPLPLPKGHLVVDDPRLLQAQYDFHDALFSHAFLYTLGYGLLSWQLMVYIVLLVLASVLGGLAVCLPGSASSSLLTGPGGGCWSSGYQFSWADLTLGTLTSFLLSLLVNNVLTRWWTVRSMVQDLCNTVIQVVFTLSFAQEPRGKGLGEEEWAERCADFRAAKARIKRRMYLAFELMLITASTQDVKDDDSCASMQGAYNGLLDRTDLILGRGEPLMTRAEWDQLGHHRFAVAPIAWCVRDAQGLLDRDIINSLRYNDLLALLVKLRTLLNDVPFTVRVQLPFVAVSLVACVVHLSLWQLVYISSSYIGLGLAGNQGGKAWAGLFSVALVSTVYLSILKLQAELVNPFRKSPTLAVSCRGAGPAPPHSHRAPWRLTHPPSLPPPEHTPFCALGTLRSPSPWTSFAGTFFAPWKAWSTTWG